LKGSSPTPPWLEEEGDATLPKFRYFPFLLSSHVPFFLILWLEEEGEETLPKSQYFPFFFFSRVPFFLFRSHFLFRSREGGKEGMADCV
jgi:hypothetical protein